MTQMMQIPRQVVKDALTALLTAPENNSSLDLTWDIKCSQAIDGLLQYLGTPYPVATPVEDEPE